MTNASAPPTLFLAHLGSAFRQYLPNLPDTSPMPLQEAGASIEMADLPLSVMATVVGENQEQCWSLFHGPMGAPVEAGKEDTVPKVKANGIDIHYETHGTGQPVVLIPGLGADTFLYFRQIPELSKHFRLIAFDPRGAGESDKPEEPYSIAMFAADTAGMLQALGIPRAHIVGSSLGGLIAIEFALTYPAMVDRLVLASTTFGGPHSVKPSLGSMIRALFVARRSGNPEADIRRSFAFFTSKQWNREHADLVDQYVAWRVAHPQPPAAYNRQRAAVPPYNAEDRVGQITAPTMVVHGRNDRLVPVRNGELLAAKIPGARLLILEDAGHACIVDHADEFNSAVVEFLKG